MRWWPFRVKHKGEVVIGSTDSRMPEVSVENMRPFVRHIRTLERLFLEAHDENTPKPRRDYLAMEIERRQKILHAGDLPVPDDIKACDRALRAAGVR